LRLPSLGSFEATQPWEFRGYPALGVLRLPSLGSFEATQPWEF